MKQYVHYGCGLVAPAEWKNFDVTPTLRIQKIPLIGGIIVNKFHPLSRTFPSNILYGDIVQGISMIEDNSCDGIYCSHILEHLSLTDFRIALKNTFKMLKKDGTFRCVLPDLEVRAENYLNNLRTNNESRNTASISFIDSLLMGRENSPKSITSKLMTLFGTPYHLWMWDNYSLKNELKNAGFVNIRKCQYGDWDDVLFELVEKEHSYSNSIAFEAKK